MKTIALTAIAILLFGCGVESVGTAASVAKLQADQAKQGKETMDKLKTDLDASLKQVEQNAKQVDEAANN